MAYLNERRNERTGKVVSYRVKYRVAGREQVETFGDRDEAIRWRDLCNLVGHEQALKALSPKPAQDTRPTVNAIVADHISGLSGVEPGTRQDYLRDARRHIAPHLGPTPAADLTRRKVSEWVNALEAAGLAPKTIKNRHALLSAALTTAVSEGVTPTNVARGVKLPEIPEIEMVFLEGWELKVILRHLKPHWRPLITFLAFSGIRWGEATALRVRDINLDRSTLRVHDAWKHHPGVKRIGVTKTRAGRRTVEFGSTIRPILEARCGTGARDDLIFTNTLGGPVDHATFHGTHWRPAVRAAMADADTPIGKEPRIHDLRHTYASWCLNRGVPIFVLSRTLGHKHASVTTDRYGHLQPDRLSLAVDAVESAFHDS